MTREKEIEQAMKESVAETIYASGYGMTPQATDLLECAFTKGAEWADANPQFSKQEFINKACEWLYKFNQNQAIKYGDKAVMGCSEYTISVYDFRKAMEE